MQPRPTVHKCYKSWPLSQLRASWALKVPASRLAVEKTPAFFEVGVAFQRDGFVDRCPVVTERPDAEIIRGTLAGLEVPLDARDRRPAAENRPTIARQEGVDVMRRGNLVKIAAGEIKTGRPHQVTTALLTIARFRVASDSLNCKRVRRKRWRSSTSKEGDAVTFGRAARSQDRFVGPAADPAGRPFGSLFRRFARIRPSRASTVSRFMSSGSNASPTH